MASRIETETPRQATQQQATQPTRTDENRTALQAGDNTPAPRQQGGVHFTDWAAI